MSTIDTLFALRASVAVIAAHRKLYDEIAVSHPSLLRGAVYCRCGKARRIDAAECLRNGWPRCCRATMTIDAPKVAS
jgi:hypothetical protein